MTKTATKTLALLRHAKSDWDDVSTRDFDRGLNDRGRRGARLIGKHIAGLIRKHDLDFDLVLASPAERVRQTLKAALPDYEPHWDERLYLASAGTLMDVIREHGGDADTVLVTAHNPGLQQLLFDLIPPEREDKLFDEAATKYPTATYAVVTLDIDNWTHLKDDCGTLVHFMRPRDLDPDLGPEGL